MKTPTDQGVHPDSALKWRCKFAVAEVQFMYLIRCHLGELPKEMQDALCWQIHPATYRQMQMADGWEFVLGSEGVFCASVKGIPVERLRDIPEGEIRLTLVAKATA